MSALPDPVDNEETPAAALTWHGHEFSMVYSILNTQIDKKPSASNKFKFVESKDTDGKIYLYTLTPVPTPEDMKEAWVACRLLPLTGAKLTRNPQKPLLDPAGSGPAHEAKMWDVVEDLYNNKIKPGTTHFERLIGLLPTRKPDLSLLFNPLEFYRVTGAFQSSNKLLLFAVVNLIGPSPVGTVAAND